MIPEKTPKQFGYFTENVWIVRQLSAGKNKQQGVLAIARLELACKLLPLQAVGFAHKPPDAVAVMGAFEISLAHCAKHLQGSGRRQRGFQVAEYHSGGFDYLSVSVDLTNKLGAGQPFVFTERGGHLILPDDRPVAVICFPVCIAR